MKNKNKNRFFFFCFSLIPGAGEMYLGFMKQGLSLMCLFWGLIMLCVGIYAEPLLFLLPVIWFYSFFHAHNLYKMPEDKFQEYPDRFLFGLDNMSDLMALPDLLKRFRTIIATGLILIGLSILWNSFTDVIINLAYSIFPHADLSWIHSMSRELPRLVAGVLIIALGISFIRGRKHTLEQFDSRPAGQRDASPSEQALPEKTEGGDQS